MIKSMTGFGRAEIFENNRKVIVEIKSVNHKYFDLSLKMPKKLNLLETAVRNTVKQQIQRGKIDLYISYEDSGSGNTSLKYNEVLAEEYISYYKRVEESFGLDNDMKASVLLRCPEVLIMEEQSPDEDELWGAIQKALQEALDNFVESRLKEGTSLKINISEKLDIMLAHVVFIEERSPQIVSDYRKKIDEKIRELVENVQIDESRLAAEVVIFADKVCVDEEIVRLKSHIMNTKDVLESGDGMGRKLDFIAQEMNREANTILSKTNDMEISSIGIELKTEIEKVREQIQNIE
ncbi:YicC/YloC family endoribonuclease [Parasporobacterium paucivorans]|uniref:TIGR00255 family protein n=1 Tax=Parasporobacterium paucivorans DSM 15970 TaxID=1122934 RepID=A0A1M6FA20_9FIRM|nr:YicC/YloC family endoribonuclease [Parasporobacterium paucivorans]SHI94530.1 TIGR00255 family protein [Parasporobacterium paucivorans DSM 15970]